MGAGLAVVGLLSIGGMLTGSRGAGLRLLAVLGLVAVMLQGLLGGFRVKLNALIGPELAMYHGVFAQVVFGLLACIATITAPKSTEEGDEVARRRAHRAAVLLVGLMYVQIAWGAWVRHTAMPLSLRLHFLTAFLVAAVAVWLMRSLLVARKPAGAWVLGFVLTVQIALGVEAWMGKFLLGIFAAESMKVTEVQAAIRTAHLLVGSLMLGTAVVVAVRTNRVKVHKAAAEGTAEHLAGTNKSDKELVAVGSQRGEIA
jgi:hypothetical protein